MLVVMNHGGQRIFLASKNITEKIMVRSDDIFGVSMFHIA